MVNIDKWNSLPKPYQSLIKTASALAHETMVSRYDAYNPAALRKLLAGGAELRGFSPAIMDACLKASNEVYAETSAKNADFKKIYDHMVAFRGEQYFWWQVAEASFDNYMIRSRSKS
jgi:TRAP-type mannitol/chloroaromatic compound transport system substrate-binding protein